MLSERTRRSVAVALAVVGVLLVIAAIVYFVEPTKSLPGFMGQAAGITAHRTKHGIAALVLGVASLAVAGYLGGNRRRVGPR